MNNPQVLNWSGLPSIPEQLRKVDSSPSVIPSHGSATAPFWAAAKLRVLMLPKLKSGRFVHPRILVERGIPADQVDWVESRGSSHLVASAVVWRSRATAFSARTPYTVLLARLDEGIQLIGVLPGAQERLIRGQRLRLAFLQVAPGHLLPTFIPELVG